MKKSVLARVLVLAAMLPLLAGCVVYRQPAVVAPAGAGAAAEPEGPPPAPVEMIPRQPDVTFVWAPGAWEWRGHWVWFAGHWGPRPHPGARWERGGWVRHDNGYVWIRAHWR